MPHAILLQNLRFSIDNADLHNGNWKVSHNKLNNLYPIIIYDLGICYNIPINLMNKL